jgi:hypothetical protein
MNASKPLIYPLFCQPPEWRPHVVKISNSLFPVNTNNIRIRKIDITRCQYNNCGMEKKRPRGRPPLDKKRVMLSIRVHEDELTAWQDAANTEGESLTNLVRNAVNRSVARKRRKGG